MRKLFNFVDTETGNECTMSECAPIKLAEEGGNYEQFIGIIRQGGYAFAETICKWLYKDYSEAMLISKSQEESQEEIEREIDAMVTEYLEQLLSNNSIPLSDIWEILDDLIRIIAPIKDRVDATAPRKLGSEKEKVKADMNYSIKYFH